MKKLIIPFLLVFIIASCNNSNEKIKPLVEEEKKAPITEFSDLGPNPTVIDIENYTLSNENFRTTIWTGGLMQMTLMSIKPGEDIGFEVHPNIEQFIRVEQGKGKIMMGDSKENIDFERDIEDDFALFIPTGKWHNIINTGDEELKLYSIYTPTEHPKGTVHVTREEALEAEHSH